MYTIYETHDSGVTKEWNVDVGGSGVLWWGTMCRMLVELGL